MDPELNGANREIIPEMQIEQRLQFRLWIMID